MQHSDASSPSTRAHVLPKARRRAPGSSAKPADAAARPATVTFENGKLKVAADNSDLSQVLEVVANTTGMVISGSVNGARVFGVYGPYSPRDVLTDLLTGSGYNFIMTGDTADGSPRQLLLSRQAEPSSPTALAPPSTVPGSNSPKEEAVPAQGQIATPPPPEDSPSAVQQRMQQKLDRLEQMRNPMQHPSTPE